MNTAERVELALVPVVGVAAAGAAGLGLLSARTDLGRVVLAAAALLLLQSLLRDLWLLRAARHAPRREAARCFCLESTIGAAGVLAGLAASLAGLGGEVALTPLGWGLLAAATTAVGFAIKDLVLGWKPLRILRDPDHMNIVVRWK